MERTNLAGRAGRWSAAHWKTAAFGWIAVAIGAVVVGGYVGAVEMKDSDYANGESARAAQILEAAGFDLPATESVLVQSRTETVDDLAFKSTLAGVVQELSNQRDVINIKSPLELPKSGLVSADRHSALVQFDLKGKIEDADDKIQPIMDAVAGVQAGNPSMLVEEFGNASANHALNERFADDLGRAEKTSLPLTIAILLVAFGSLVAAGIPVVLAFSAVLAATGLNTLFSHLVPTQPETLGVVILMIGMAVGIDYSLFYVQREREERRNGLPPHRSLLRAAATSGQAVLISGVTVLIAMAGMLVAGNSIFTTMAIGTMIVVAMAIIASLSVLPALLHRLGDNVERGSIPILKRQSNEGRFWGAVAAAVMQKPVRSLLVSGGALALLALPALTMHTKLPTLTDLPQDMPILRTYHRIQAAFPGSQTPAQLVVSADNVERADISRAYDLFRERALATGQLFAPFTVTVNPDKTVALVQFSIAGNGDDEASLSALRTLREDVIPPIAGPLDGVETAVTGITAGTYDFNEQMKVRLPFVFAFVLGLAFVLLLLTFRSLVIAAKAVALNVLSVAASYGILVAVFQHEWAEGVLGFRSNHSITSWLPLFMFVVLFGLSMDYHVFILSRMKELHDAGMSTDDAVRHGIARTAGTVTSAAVIMVAVFALFATLSPIQIKQMGFGLAVAVLIDATVVRGVLLPSAMKLLGEWNWYLPPWLEWLPTLSPEGGPREERASGRALPTA